MPVARLLVVWESSTRICSRLTAVLRSFRHDARLLDTVAEDVHPLASDSYLFSVGDYDLLIRETTT